MVERCIVRERIFIRLVLEVGKQQPIVDVEVHKFDTWRQATAYSFQWVAMSAQGCVARQRARARGYCSNEKYTDRGRDRREIRNAA